MTIGPGSRFGHYEIVEAIGAGGMGEVWRARDTTLERDVAIKVLPDAFATDTDRLARFEREAKTLASLNHPNIAQVFGLEKSAGSTAIVMELVDGPTLADRIARGPIPADEALGLAMQIANALEAAHGARIVHRDLKPANIKLKADGTVRVLDFGIAKAVDLESISGKPAEMTTPAMTQTGVILGTAAYMSPEQARGMPVDQRTDIWAFGCLLFEMLTGQPAFVGEDVMTTLARVLANDTDLASMPGTIAGAVRQTIKLCLEKKPNKRIADIRDVKLALAGAFEADLDAGSVTGPVPATLRQRALLPAAALVVGLLTAGLAVFAVMRPGAPEIARFDVTPANQTIMSNSPSVAISPDGRSIAYLVGGVSSAGAAELRLRTLDSLEDRVLTTDRTIASPFFSPDGLEIAYYVNLQPLTLRRVSVQGGSASSIATFQGALRGASWGADGTIVYGTADPTTGLWRVAARGGTPELLTTPGDGEGDHMFPEILPGGETVLFVVVGSTEDESRIEALSLVTGERTIVQNGGSSPRYSPTGHLLFGRAGTLWAVAFDPETLATRGNPAPVQEGVLTKGTVGATEVSLAADGTLLFVAGDAASPERGLIFVNSAGEQQVALQAGGPIDSVALSRDGRSAAISTFGDGGGADILVADLTRPGSLVRLTRGSGLNRNPRFSPDGRRIVWGREIGGHAELFWQSADASGVAESMLAFEPPVTRVVPRSWWDGTDESILTLDLVDRDGTSSLGFMRIGDPDSLTPLGSPDFSQSGAAISPDGRWFAYSSDDKGFPEIYIERFPDGGDRRDVSIGGGAFPMWSQDGRTLSYVRLGGGVAPFAVERVTLTGGSAPDEPLTVSRPTELFAWSFYATGSSMSTIDMAPDGDRFLVISSRAIGESAQPTRTILVQNWVEELERLVPNP